VKILYLILAAEEFPYAQLREDGLKTTWLTRLSDEDRVIHLFSHKSLGKSEVNRGAFLAFDGTKVDGKRELQDIFYKDGDSWTFPTFSGWDSILHKTLSALNYALLECDFDFVVRTAPTSLWNPMELRRKLTLLGPSMGAFGTVREFSGKKYIEGSNLVISRDIVSKLVNNPHLFNFGIIDDVAIGRVLTQLNIPMIDWPRPRIERLWDFYDLRYGDFSRIYTFRCRSSSPYNEKVLNNEIRTLRKLHKILLKSSNY
jgi:hypothetical protein